MSAAPEKPASLGLGLLATALGVGIILMVLANPAAAEVPLWVVYAAGAAFLFAGLSTIARALGLPTVAKIFALGIAWLLAVPGLWILFDGAGCSVSATIAGLGTSGAAADWSCRAAFGAGAILTLGTAVLFTWMAVRPRRASPTDHNPDRA